MGEARYRLLLTRSFEKDLGKLERKDQEHCLDVLEILERDPLDRHSGLDVKRLTGFQLGRYRLRFGSYRITCDIKGNDIVVRAVKRRRDAYR